MKQFNHIGSGTFITLEGGEGVGKSSQIEQLQKFFENAGHKVLVTREPGGSQGAEAVRHVLLSGAAEPLGPEVEAMLFFAARSDNVETLIKPALEAGEIVLCDRFYDSSRVYQGKTGNVSEELIEQLIAVACEDAIPDLTIVLDIDPAVGLERAAKRRTDGNAPDRFEKESLDLQNQRRKGFLEIAEKEPQRVVVVNGDQSESEVFDSIIETITTRLPDLIEENKPITLAKPIAKPGAKPSSKTGAAKTGAAKTKARKSPAKKARAKTAAPSRAGSKKTAVKKPTVKATTPKAAQK